MIGEFHSPDGSRQRGGSARAPSRGVKMPPMKIKRGTIFHPCEIK